MTRERKSACLAVFNDRLKKDLGDPDWWYARDDGWNSDRDEVPTEEDYQIRLSNSREAIAEQDRVEAEEEAAAEEERLEREKQEAAHEKIKKELLEFEKAWRDADDTPSHLRW